MACRLTSRSDFSRRPFARRHGALAAGVALALAACSPIEGWRSISGVAKNDPGPDAPFAGNLADADAAPYPNLATVPPPPSRATSLAERQKLAQSLIADRTAAAAQAGPPAAAPPTAAPAAPPKPASPKPGSASISLPAAPSPPPAPAVAAPAPPAAAAPPDRAADAARPERRGAGAATEQPPQDSTLQVPQVRSTPEPEAPRPALPPPRLAAVPPVARTDPAEAVAASVPQAPPAAPSPAVIAPPPAAPRAEPRRPPVPMTVATLDRIDRGQIEQVAGLYKEQPGTVRVVARAAPPAPGADPLAGYHAALDRAQTVAKALAEAGIPANRIQAEATPAAAGAGAAGRVEIQFLP